jgi:hypothetical protein
MTTIDATHTLAELVTDHPGLARELERLGLDYCCGANAHSTRGPATRGSTPGKWPGRSAPSRSGTRNRGRPWDPPGASRRYHEQSEWCLVVQQARNLTMACDLAQIEILIRDRDTKFTQTFDHVFNAEGIQVIRMPVRAPRANAFAERFVRTVRQEWLDWTLVRGRRPLRGGPRRARRALQPAPTPSRPRSRTTRAGTSSSAPARPRPIAAAPVRRAVVRRTRHRRTTYSSLTSPGRLPTPPFPS